jgi:hypothetical protein
MMVQMVDVPNDDPIQIVLETSGSGLIWIVDHPTYVYTTPSLFEAVDKALELRDRLMGLASDDEWQ